MVDWILEWEEELYDKIPNRNLDDDEIFEMMSSFKEFEEVIDDTRKVIAKFTVCKIKDIYVGIEWTKPKDEYGDSKIIDWYEVVPKVVSVTTYNKK